MTKSLHEQALEAATIKEASRQSLLVAELPSANFSDPVFKSIRDDIEKKVADYLAFLAGRNWKPMPKGQTDDMIRAFHDPDGCDSPTCYRCRWVASYDAAPSPEDAK